MQSRVVFTHVVSALCNQELFSLTLCLHCAIKSYFHSRCACIAQSRVIFTLGKLWFSIFHQHKLKTVSHIQKIYILYWHAYYYPARLKRAGR